MHVVAALLIVLCSACTASSSGSSHPHAVATDAPNYGVPTHLFVAHIRAPHPSGDPDSWDDVLNTARDAVCPNANTYGIQTPEVSAQGAVVAVHCDGRLRYVQVTFQGVQVPYLVGLRPEQASKRLALIDLSLGSVTYRSSRGAKAGTIVEQSARHGKVLASGGQVDVVVAKP